ncbi:MAG: DUF2384 domain-containing protein [Comamonadaceae bacterium]|nr:MAG: DUF2384 domain-containing protein [Comamonadaceae bacterium]
MQLQVMSHCSNPDGRWDQVHAGILAKKAVHINSSSRSKLSWACELPPRCASAHAFDLIQFGRRTPSLWLGVCGVSTLSRLGIPLMESSPPDASVAQGAVAPSAIEKEILRLQKEKEKLLERREAVKRETLHSLADAFARKLQAAGLTVREGIEALRPYSHLKLHEEVTQRSSAIAARPSFQRSPHPGRARPVGRAAPPPSTQDSLEGYAQQVLGAGGKDWMDQPNLLLGGERPNAPLGQHAGLARVRALLKAFEQGS